MVEILKGGGGEVLDKLPSVGGGGGRDIFWNYTKSIYSSSYIGIGVMGCCSSIILKIYTIFKYVKICVNNLMS